MIYGSYEGVYSYKNKNKNKNNDNKNYIILPYFKKPVFTGIKWECIEFVRRFFILKKGLTFQSVENVYNMIFIKFFICIYHHTLYNVHFYHINENIIPKKYDIILLFDDTTGHTGIITKYDRINRIIYFIDQNNEEWEDKDYSKKISIEDNNIIGFLRIKEMTSN